MKKEKLLLSLEQEDLGDEQKKYIRAVVDYIDNIIARTMEKEHVTMGTYIREMVEIAKQIEQRKTGELSIDGIGTIFPYIENYIVAISENGGIYKYVLQTYEQEIKNGEVIKTTEQEEKDTEQLRKQEMKVKLLSSLEQEDIGDEQKKYIRAVVDYIDNIIARTMKKEHVTIGTYIREMVEIAKQIEQRKTGELSIDGMGRRFPYLENYIVAISENGGIYKYVLELYEQEIKNGEVTKKTKQEEKTSGEAEGEMEQEEKTSGEVEGGMNVESVEIGEETNSITTIEESKFAEIHSQAKGRSEEMLLKIRSFIRGKFKKKEDEFIK